MYFIWLHCLHSYSSNISCSSFQTIVDHSLVHFITNVYKYLKIAFRRLNTYAAVIKVSMFIISMDIKKYFFSVFVLTPPDFFQSTDVLIILRFKDSRKKPIKSCCRVKHITMSKQSFGADSTPETNQTKWYSAV